MRLQGAEARRLAELDVVERSLAEARAPEHLAGEIDIDPLRAKQANSEVKLPVRNYVAGELRGSNFSIASESRDRRSALRMHPRWPPTQNNSAGVAAGSVGIL
jgi:hypothetical protein